jgi:hypothetical protein
MRITRSGRLSATTAKRLLGGDPDGGLNSLVRNDKQAALAQFLAAATRPGTASELRGESAARAVFISLATTHPLPDEAPRSTPMRARTLSRIVIAKAVVALTLTAGAGGVALATTSTSLPVEDTETVASTTAAPPTAAIDVHIPDEADERDTTGSDEASADPADANGSRGLTGLCRAWVAGADSNGKRATNPAFSRLTAAAGGDDLTAAAGGDAMAAVDGFCATLAAKQPTEGQPTTTPTATPEPTAKPGEDKRAEAAAHTATGKPAGATGPDRGNAPEKAEKPSGKPDTAVEDQSGDRVDEEPTKAKKATADE